MFLDKPGGTGRVGGDPTPGEPELGPCLSEEAVVAFSDGNLMPAEIESLQAHLDHCEACLELVNAVVHQRDDASGTAVSSGRLWMETFGAGQLVASRFRIDRFIGRGGMGEVYLAHDVVLDEPVALKTLLSTISDNPQALRRLLGEVRLARRISHPNVCRVHDVGLHEEPGRVDERLHFLTMEFIDGPRLGQLVRSRRLELPLVLEIARQILVGLGAAHSAGVLHRDLKSDNIMLSGQTLDGQGAPFRIAITDFGLAQALDGALTSRGGQERVGSVSHMAPEQILGLELSPASDLFAFGVVLFEMLCAELPFRCGDGSRQAALRRLLEKPVAPSQLRPDVPPALDRLVLRCLMQRPRDRFASADEALAVLESLSAACRPSAIYERPWGSALDEAASPEIPRIKGLVWAGSAEAGASEIPLGSVAALLKA